MFKDFPEKWGHVYGFSSSKQGPMLRDSWPKSHPLEPRTPVYHNYVSIPPPPPAFVSMIYCPIFGQLVRTGRCMEELCL